jgi:CubicO group peptidase (beta-lactamase class C family)
VTANTAFQLASATKLFTGVALMLLVEDGLLSLDDPIAKFFEGAPAAWQRVTVRHLATHTSGLSEQRGEHPDTVAGVVAGAMEAPLAYEPGTRSQYGFVDFTVLRAIFEKVSGKPLPQLFEAEIFRPLGLTDTGFNYEHDQGDLRLAVPLPRRASTHTFKDGRQYVSSFVYGETGYAAGGLYSSVADLAKLLAALARGDLIEPESFRLLQTNAILADGSSGEFGIGWATRKYHGIPVAGHSGGPALADVLHFDSLGLSIVVLTNQQRLLPLLAEGVADFFLPPAPPLAGIADTRPEMTGQLVTALRDAGRGEIVADRFTASARQGLVPFLSEYGEALMTALGPITGTILLEDRQDGEMITRRYAIEFARKRMYWVFAVDGAGLIADMHPESER